MTEQNAPEEDTLSQNRSETDAPASPSPPTSGAAPLEAPAPAPGLPSWVPPFLLAVVPALVVGLLVYLFAGSGGGGGSGRAAGIVDGFVRSGGPTASAIESFKGKLPPGFPSEFPRYSGSELVVSFAVRSAQQGSFYIVVYNTSATPEAVLDFYQNALNNDPWQVEGARSGIEGTAVRFSRPDSADVQGEVDIYRSELDGRTSVYVYYQDVSSAGRRSAEEREFVLGRSRPLPPGFPNDIPIYRQNDSTIIQTIFERGPGATSFLVSFLTRDSQNDVIRFYTNEFERRGWSVTNAQGARGFVLGIDFSDGARQNVQGSVYADLFEQDSQYTRVDLILQVSTRR